MPLFLFHVYPSAAEINFKLAEQNAKLEALRQQINAMVYFLRYFKILVYSSFVRLIFLNI